jgi:hypothetical protein
LVIALALVALLSSGAVATGQPDGGVVAAQVTVAQAVIIRVPARRSRRYAPGPGAAPPAPPVYRERRGPRCIEAAAIAGAAVTAPDAVDFILKGGRRVRARLADECPALDYYSGFYVKPPADGQICADRDSLHTRSGGDCQVDRFRALTPIPPAH